MKALLEHMNLALCLPTNSVTVERGLRLALKYSLGERDALILASYLSSKDVSAFVTMDRSLLSLKEIGFGKKMLRIVSPARS